MSRFPRSALDDADEVFLATTAGGVMPASRIGARILGNDRPGPLSMRLKDTYWRKHEEGGTAPRCGRWRRTLANETPGPIRRCSLDR